MHASGGNYRITLEDGVVHWLVWARPDVDSQQGARFAEEQILHSVSLAMGASRGLFFDITEAPTVMGPRTTAAIEATLAPWERAKKPVAIFVAENAMQRLQWERIVREQAHSVGRVFAARPSALAWAGSKLALLACGLLLGRGRTASGQFTRRGAQTPPPPPQALSPLGEPLRGCLLRGCLLRGCLLRGCLLRGCLLRGCLLRGCPLG